MKITRKVKSILDNYGADSPGVRANLARILMQGKLGGTRQARHPAGRSGLRAWTSAKFCCQSGCV